MSMLPENFDDLSEEQKIEALAEVARVDINTLEARAKKLLRECPADEDARTLPEEVLAELKRVIQPDAGHPAGHCVTHSDIAGWRKDAICKALPYLRPAADEDAAEWRTGEEFAEMQRLRPADERKPDAEVADRVRIARHQYLTATAGTPRKQEAGRRLACHATDLLAAYEKLQARLAHATCEGDEDAQECPQLSAELIERARKRVRALRKATECMEEKGHRSWARVARFVLNDVEYFLAAHEGATGDRKPDITDAVPPCPACKGTGWQDGCGDERLTREGWLAQLEQAAAEAQNGEDWYVKLWFTKAGGNDAWAAQGQEKVVYGSDPIAALEALAEVKPSRPDPDEMTTEELKAELDAAEGVEWLPYQVTLEDGAVWHYAAVTLHGELIKNVNGESREQVLRNAVSVLRKLPNIECPQCGWNAVNATWYEGEPGRCFYTCPECGCDPDNLREHLDAQESDE